MKPARSYWFTRLCFQRALAFVYVVAFICAAQQFIPLLGEHGLLPVRVFLRQLHFWQAPSLFWLDSSDLFITFIIGFGLSLSLAALTGWSERFGVLVSAVVWSLLWFFYLSLVNVGQVFYGFGWETMLLEAGFLAIFLGSSDVKPPAAVIWFLRWVLFRLMFGAGLIKIRGDSSWTDLTALFYHYETQPIPNPLSWYFHHLPHWFLKFQTLYTHFVELIVPWLYCIPGKPIWIAGILTIAFQVCLILSGNLSWLNYLTIAIAIACFDDSFFEKILRRSVPSMKAPGPLRKGILAAFSGLILVLSVPPALNLLSPRQMMNASFEPLHLVNTYGAFGSITKNRNEVILEGTSDEVISPATVWVEYAFKAKPGDPHHRPGVIAPYHLRLDWLMWFAAMDDWRYHPWMLNLVYKLLQNDERTLSLLDKNPFPEKPPRHIRAMLYSYRFTTQEERRKSGDWWVREPVDVYLPALSLDSTGFRKLVRAAGWE